MEEFKGLSRDTVREKNPAGTWEFARNILLSKGFLSITNEDGFDYKHDIPGTFIGKIETNEEIVYFSVDGAFSCIGIYKTNEDVAVYIPVIRSIYLGFKINRPIEGIFFYNFKGELIISFCDGVFLDSNTPKLINTTNIGIPLTISFELVNPADLNQLNLTPSILTGDIAINYNANGAFEGEVVYITYSYVLADNITTTPFIPIHNIAYPMEDFRQNKKRDVILSLTKLDSNYNKLKLGILVLKDNGLFAYQSSIRSYGGTIYNTTISSLTSFISISTEELLIPSIIYNRIKTMTLVNSELVIGNIATEEDISFQKYANLLELSLRFDTREIEKHNHPILSPDEVYSFVISLHFLSGNYSKEFHIPGIKPTGIETNDLTTLELTTLGIEELGLTETIKRFRVFNTGGFNTITGEAKDVYTSQSILNWGYWQNQELYPNNNEYDSTIDYNLIPIIGGEDLRNTPIRYHRVPGLDNLVKNFPCVIGENNKNTDELVGRNGGDFKGAIPAFAVAISNFDTIVPASIKAKIQGYKLSIVKRQRGDSIVEDISFLKQVYKPGDLEVGSEITTLTIGGRLRDDGNTTIPEIVRQFGFSKIRSTTLSVFTPQINPRLIKANYGINLSKAQEISSVPEGLPEIDVLSPSFTQGNVGYNNIDSKPAYTLVSDTQRFAVFKDLRYLPGNNIAAETQYADSTMLFTAHNSLVPLGGFTALEVPTRWNPLLWNRVGNLNENTINGTLDGFNPITSLYTPTVYNSTEACYQVGISITLINLLTNAYSGFNPRDFITIGQVSLRNDISDYTLQNQLLRDGGDIFTSNLYNRIESSYRWTGVFIPYAILMNQVVLKGMFSPANNTEVYMLKDRKLGMDFGGATSQSELNAFIYENTILHKESFSSLNNLIVGIAFDINAQEINYFPFRIQRSLKVANENLSTSSIRTFPANKYQEMLNDRGEIIALRGSNKTLYIQQRFSLFIASLKDKLTTQDSVTYLGEGDIFDRTPDEVLDASNRGFLGSSSQFACILYRDGYVTIDQVKGKIYIVSGTQGLEISKEGMNIWFEENSNTDSKYYNLNRLGIKQTIDNPYTQVGHLIGFDLKYNRLLWTKKDYRFKDENLEEEDTYDFNGEYYYVNDILILYTDTFWFEDISKTFSFSLDWKKWSCEHDYFPNCYAYTNKGTYAIQNLPEISKVFKMNSRTVKGTYFNQTFNSYVDLIFNGRLDLSKAYQVIEWQSVCKSVQEATNYHKTVDSIVIYSDYQCSGEIPVSEFNTSRNVEGVWNFNEFRDIVIDASLPLVDEEGELLANNLNINKSYFEKSVFIGTFVVVRLIMKNTNSDSIYINFVNVKSRMSKR